MSRVFSLLPSVSSPLGCQPRSQPPPPLLSPIFPPTTPAVPSPLLSPSSSLIMYVAKKRKRRFCKSQFLEMKKKKHLYFHKSFTPSYNAVFFSDAFSCFSVILSSSCLYAACFLRAACKYLHWFIAKTCIGIEWIFWVLKPPYTISAQV